MEGIGNSFCIWGLKKNGTNIKNRKKYKKTKKILPVKSSRFLGKKQLQNILKVFRSNNFKPWKKWRNPFLSLDLYTCPVTPTHLWHSTNSRAFKMAAGSAKGGLLGWRTPGVNGNASPSAPVCVTSAENPTKPGILSKKQPTAHVSQRKAKTLREHVSKQTKINNTFGMRTAVGALIQPAVFVKTNWEVQAVTCVQ